MYAGWGLAPSCLLCFLRQWPLMGGDSLGVSLCVAHARRRVVSALRLRLAGAHEVFAPFRVRIGSCTQWHWQWHWH